MQFPVLSGSVLYPAENVPLAVMRVANNTHARHGHDFQEIVLVVGGKAEHLIYPPDSDEPKCHPIAENDIFWVPVGWSHSYKAEAPVEIYNILFSPTVLGDWHGEELPLGSGTSVSALNPLVNVLHLRRSERETIEGLLRVIMRELTLQKSGFEIAARAKIADVLVYLQRLISDAPDQSRALWDEAGVMVKAISFLEEHFDKPISLRDIARAVHLSPNYFCEQFTLATGEPPGRYLLRLRLEHARFLLLTTPISVTETARQSGFSDPSYFARAFKASFGVAPSRMRATGR